MMLTSAYVLKTTGNLYPPPSFDFIPSLYAPIYFYILKFSFLFENYYLIARLLSLFSYIMAGIFFSLVIRIRFSNFLALLSFSMIFSFFGLSGYWFDLIRVDGFHIFFISSLLYTQTKFNPSIFQVVTVTIIFLISVFTKQSAIILFPITVFYYILFQKYKLAFIQLLSFLVAIFFIITYLQFKTDGYFFKYTWILGNTHSYIAETITQSIKLFYGITKIQIKYINISLLGITIVYLLLLKVFLVNIIKGKRCSRKKIIDFYLISFSFSLILISTLLSIHKGSSYNNSIPLLFSLFIIIPYNIHYFFLILKRFKKIQYLKIYYKVLSVIIFSYCIHANYHSSLKKILPNPILSSIKRIEVNKFLKLL
ncbi:MAG: hypothetical protein KDK90_07250, partial [Leptospiraceae bacterium]|nr:hypothetical protein [Leptospiraceae bacterium]